MFVMMGSNEVDTSNYARWDSRVEKIPPGEADDNQAVADMILVCRKFSSTIIDICTTAITYERVKQEHVLIPPPGTHARTQGIVKGKLIAESLPPHLAPSLFSTLAEYPFAMPYSSEPGDSGFDGRILSLVAWI